MLETNLITDYLVRENCNGAEKLMHYDVVAIFLNDGYLHVAYISDGKIFTIRASALHVMKKRATISEWISSYFRSSI